jgi:D-psicose/D-tagatose/L-ribulose 3-epimerase
VKLSVSNIAWPSEMDAEAMCVLRDAGIAALEIAPTRLWPDWVGASPAAAKDAAAQFARSGFRISSLQAILFAKPECRLFGSDGERQLLFEHLALCADLATGLGATYLVFGAPKNRDLCGKSDADAFQIAREFFRAAGDYFERKGLCLCLEPNPPQYGCHFVTDSSEASRLVHAVGSAGFRLHLDTGCMLLAGEDPVEAIRAHAGILAHFHVSEPFLGTLNSPNLHQRAIRALDEVGYANWVTLEMRAAAQPILALSKALSILVESACQQGRVCA